MKLLAMIGLSLVAAVGAQPAAADPVERDVGSRPPVQDQRPRHEPQRDTRAPGEPDRSRMSPDERRQLRRDVQDAGKDIYRRDRPAPAPAPRREQRR